MRRVTTTFKTLRPAVVLIGDQATEDFTSIEATVVWQHIGSKMLGGDISNVTNIDDGGCYGVTATAGLSGNICMGASAVAAQT